MKARSGRKRLSYALGITALGAALAWAFWPHAAEVDVAAVARGAMRVSVDEDGRTRVKERYVVSAPLAGRVQQAGVCRLDHGHNGATGRDCVPRVQLDPRQPPSAIRRAPGQRSRGSPRP